MAKSNPNSPANYGPAMRSAFKNTSTFGVPGAKQTKPKARPMAKPVMKMAMPSVSTTMRTSTPMTMSRPNKRTVRSAASKLFGGRF